MARCLPPPLTRRSSVVPIARGCRTFGQYVGVKTDRHGEWIKFQGLIMVGHSGGPVVDEQGEVVAWNVRSEAQGLCDLRPIASGRPVIEAAERRLAELA